MLITDDANVPVKSVKHLDICRLRISDHNRDTNGQMHK